MKVFLCGDVMAGRGIDQIMPRPCEPTLYEPYVNSALGYVTLAESRSGSIPRSVAPDYIWGEALAEIDRHQPDFRIGNLETSVTDDGEPEPKGINYRMHPDNLGCITAARIDCCVFANNHAGDWGLKALRDTVDALEKAGLSTAGAGRDADRAARPALLSSTTAGRLLVLACGSPSSGIPERWAAGADRPGVNLLTDLGRADVARIARDIDRWKRPGDLVLVSIHWGANWGYEIPEEHRTFAHALIDRCGVDIVHGHSSHHPIAIEVHAGKPILYGCGDFINDYEGIGGHEAFHPDLVLTYFVEIDDANHALRGIEMVPFRIARFRLERASAQDADWLRERLDRECGRFGHRVEKIKEGTLALLW